MQVSPAQIAAVVVALLPLITSLSGVIFKGLVAKLPEAKRAMVEQQVGVAVNAVEQKARAGLLDGSKRKAAEDMAVSLLAGVGIKADPAVLDAFIEAAVSDMNADKPVAVSVPQGA